MASLFGRVCALTVGAHQFTELRIEFKIIKSIRSKPNAGEVTVYNLADDTRLDVEVLGNPVTLIAGYRELNGIIFLGQLTDSWSQRKKGDAADWKTIVHAKDGAKEFRSRVIRRAFKGRTTKADAMLAIAKAMGIAPPADLSLVQGLWENGVSFNGICSKYIDLICTSLGLEWSIQDGVMQLTSTSGATTEEAILLSPQTGLVEIPEQHESRLSKSGGKGKHAKKRHVKAVSLLNPRIKPGRRVVIESNVLQGNYVVHEAVHEGDTHGQKWTSTMELYEV